MANNAKSANVRVIDAMMFRLFNSACSAIYPVYWNDRFFSSLIIFCISGFISRAIFKISTVSSLGLAPIRITSALSFLSTKDGDFVGLKSATVARGTSDPDGVLIFSLARVCNDCLSFFGNLTMTLISSVPLIILCASSP